MTDKNVDSHYGNRVKSGLVKAGYDVKLMALEPGEETKSFDTLPKIYNELLGLQN